MNKEYLNWLFDYKKDEGKIYWRNNISVNKKRYRLGYFDTELEAHLAYMNKAKELGVL